MKRPGWHAVPKPTIGDQPIEPAFRELMNGTARILDETFNGEAKGNDRTVGFVLLLFQLNSDGERDSRCNYISNANRADIVVMLKEQIARFEGMPEPPTGHA